MFVAISKLIVTNGNADGLAEQYIRRSHLVDDAPGFVSFEVLRNTEDPCEFLVYIRWEDRASFDAYYQKQDFKAAHRNVATIPGGVKIDRETRVLSTYEIVTT